MTGGTGERSGAGRGRLALIVPGISARGAAEFRRGGPGGFTGSPGAARPERIPGEAACRGGGAAVRTEVWPRRAVPDSEPELGSGGVTCPVTTSLQAGGGSV